MLDDKYNLFVELNDNNDIMIDIENNKYNLEEFINLYCKDENINESSDNKNSDNKNNKEKFVYKKKRRQIQNTQNIQNIQNIQNKINNELIQDKENEIETNEHQKKRRKRRIIDDDSEEENNKKEENNEKENLSNEIK